MNDDRATLQLKPCVHENCGIVYRFPNGIAAAVTVDAEAISDCSNVGNDTLVPG